MDAARYIADLADVDRARAIVGAYTEARLAIIAARPGNPMGAEIRGVGAARALMARNFAAPHFNCGYGFSDEHVEALPEILAWYAQGRVEAMFELAPGRPIERTSALLTAAGYAHRGFHATFAGPSILPQEASPGIAVARVESAEGLTDFADAYHKGWGHADFRIPMAPWLSSPGWRLYVARVAGRVAGAAILFLAGEDAYLADSAVDPAFRRRGAHRALLDRRCAEAAEAGALRVYSGADFLSPSARNMQRKGLVLLHTEALWRLDRGRLAADGG